MLKISQKTKPSKAAVILPLAEKKEQLYHGRLALISNMSGYPSAVHVIGRLQRQIDLSSYEGLLHSIKKLRDITKITADVIDSMEGVKVEKYQLNRVEIATYVQNVTANFHSFQPDPDDIDLIAHLITSFEANTGAWVLQGAVKEKDIHLDFKSMYSSILHEQTSNDIPVYAPHEDSITVLSKLPQFVIRKKTTAEGQQTEDLENSKLTSAATLYSFAATRIIDHVYQLMMDRDVWYSFVSPRAKAEVSTNLERSKSLKVFSLYLQSLLSYNQFFMLESFLKGYDLVQDWITHFPPLEASTLHKLDNVVRPHDLLNAKMDVKNLFDSFTDPSDHSLATKLIVFPGELVGSFGIANAIERINASAASFITNADIKDVADLDDKKYLPLLAGVAADSFNISHDLATIILTGKIVSGEIDSALAELVPALVRGASRSTIEALRGVGLTAHLPFSVPHALQWSIGAGVVKGLSQGKLSLDSAAPSFSWAYHEHVRKNFKFKMATDDQIVKSYDAFADLQVADKDKASFYRELFGQPWRSLVPDFWQTGNTIYTRDTLKSDPSAVRHLIEAMSGRNFEIVIREMSVPHLARIWATYLSSFALLYVDDATVRPNNKEKGDKVKQTILIEGHGRPYGASYTALQNKQAPISSGNDLIVITEGIYLRILDKIPVVTDDLIIDPHFYLEHPSMYFASNSQTIPVTQWVIDDSLQHLCLMPAVQRPAVPPVMFTNKYAYLTAELVMNMDLYFKPSSPSPAREVLPINFSKQDWPYDKFTYFLDYVTFGQYGAPKGQIDVSAETELVKDAVAKIEQTIITDNDEAAKIAASSGSAIAGTMKNIAKEVDDANKKKESDSESDDPAPLSPTN